MTFIGIKYVGQNQNSTSKLNKDVSKSGSKNSGVSVDNINKHRDAVLANNSKNTQQTDMPQNLSGTFSSYRDSVSNNNTTKGDMPQNISGIPSSFRDFVSNNNSQKPQQTDMPQNLSGIPSSFRDFVSNNNSQKPQQTDMPQNLSGIPSSFRDFVSDNNSQKPQQTDMPQASLDTIKRHHDNKNKNAEKNNKIQNFHDAFSALDNIGKMDDLFGLKSRA